MKANVETIEKYDVDHFEKQFNSGIAYVTSKLIASELIGAPIL